MSLVSTVERLEGPNRSMRQGRCMYDHWGLESKNQGRDRVWWLYAAGKCTIERLYQPHRA